MSAERTCWQDDWRAVQLAHASELRPQLHRYCARLMGSVIDGEDVVQDTIARAFVALQDLDRPPPLRPWLFQIAHNRALDLLRGRALRNSEPIEAAAEIVDPTADTVEALMREEAVNTAVSRFIELPTLQRSVVILKDVLDQSLREIADLLGLSVDSVKSHLARGRARLREINARASATTETRTPSADVERYVALFNARNWDGLRALLADDVKLIQSAQAPRVGATEVGSFFTNYAKLGDGLRLAPAWLDGKEVIAVYEGAGDPKPAYIMWLEWCEGRIIRIRDYRYVRYVIADAELTTDNGAVQ